MKAIVIGAGIGGLSAAVALRNAGIACEVFEAVKEIKPVGAAISIWPNGVKCMNRLGMGEIIDAYGGPMHLICRSSISSPSEIAGATAKGWCGCSTTPTSISINASTLRPA